MDRKHGVKSIQIDLPKATVVDVPGNQEGAVPNGAKLRKLWDAFGAGVFGLRGPNRGGLAH